MRRLLLVALAVAGCSRGTPEEEQRQDVIAALNQGNGEACTNEATVQVVRNIVFGDLQTGAMTAEEHANFLATLDTGMDLVTLDGVDEVTKKMSCRGNFVATWQGEGGSAPISYTIQPSLDDEGGIVVYVDDVRGARSSFYAARAAYDRITLAPSRVAEAQMRGHREAYAKANLFCETGGRGQPGQIYSLNGPRILEAGAALGVPPTDPIYECVQRIVARGPERVASVAATSSPPPVVVPRKEDRVEYTGPPVIVPGPPPPPAPPAPPRPSMITNPSWARQPTPEFPERAQAGGIVSGAVSLDCQIQPNGSLSDCSVVSEDPAGAGFAQAALAATRRARLSPRTVDGAAPGARTRFTVRFRDDA